MVQSPLGRREPTWIDPAWSAVKVASHLRTWDAVVPLAKVYSVVMVSASCTWSAVGTTERTPFSTTERVVPVAALVTVRVKALERVRNARSVIAGVGSTMSIEPLSVTVCASPLNVQPAKSMRTESGTGSPSELVGGDGLRVGVQLADDVAIAGAPGMGPRRTAGRCGIERRPTGERGRIGRDDFGDGVGLGLRENGIGRRRGGIRGTRGEQCDGDGAGGEAPDPPRHATHATILRR